MDFRQIKQFVVLATELNYRKAAERLHMTQPPLSIAIKRLETEIGAELFERDRQGVRLTVAASPSWMKPGACSTAPSPRCRRRAMPRRDAWARCASARCRARR